LLAAAYDAAMPLPPALRRPPGFSLMELMIVLAVLAILALVALPTFTDKLVREQVAEALPLAGIAKPAIESAWRLGLPLPAGNMGAGLPEPEKIVNAVVSSVRVQDGAIHIRFGNRAHAALKGKTLTLRAAVVEDTPIVPITWLCGAARPPQGMTAKGANLTDIPTGYLPLRCR
jgi:type IV pilus assembly protein PilA